MTRSVTLAAHFMMAMAGAVAAQDQQTADLVALTYRCEDGTQIPVIYVNPPGSEGYATAIIESKLVGMRHVISASGARYRSGDGAGDYQLWSKGDSAMISVGADGDDRVLYQNCTATD